MIGAIKDEIVRQVVDSLIDETDREAARKLREVAALLATAGPAGNALAEYYEKQARRLEKRRSSL
ncbi:MAG TPA: hypothetical protein VJN63_02335 [Thermoplasmata archaeon]|nr:hypothetical protein [Thermoplasmata archaeon]